MIGIAEQATASELKLRDMLQTIVLAIARRTKHPEIEHLPHEALFTLSIDGHDQGRLIGRLGQTIWGIQTLLWYGGLTQLGWSYSVKLLEPNNPVKERQPVPFKFNPNYDRKKIEKLIGNVLDVCLKHYCSWSLTETGPANLTVNLKLMQYLKINLTEPSFPEAFETVVRVAGMSNGVQIKTEVTWD